MFWTIYLWGLLLSVPISIYATWRYIKWDHMHGGVGGKYKDTYDITIGHVIACLFASISSWIIVLFTIIFILQENWSDIIDFKLFTIKKKQNA